LGLKNLKSQFISSLHQWTIRTTVSIRKSKTRLGSYGNLLSKINRLILRLIISIEFSISSAFRIKYATCEIKMGQLIDKRREREVA
jgi:hypothetical protein